MSKFSQKITTNRFVVRFRTDSEFRLLVTALFGSCCTTAVGVYNLVFAMLLANFAAVWLYTLAGYFLTLAFARIVLLVAHRRALKKRDVRQAERQAIDAYLGGGALIVLLTLIYSGIIVLITVNDFHYNYRGNMIFVMAIYAFFKIIFAIVNAVKDRRANDLTRQTFRNVNLTDGIVSIVALQSAMLFAYSTESNFSNTMNTVVGGVAGALMLALGTYMIIRGSHLRIRYREKTHEQI